MSNLHNLYNTLLFHERYGAYALLVIKARSESSATPQMERGRKMDLGNGL